MLLLSPPSVFSPAVSSAVLHRLSGVINEYFATLMQAPEVPLVYNHGNYRTCKEASDSGVIKLIPDKEVSAPAWSIFKAWSFTQSGGWWGGGGWAGDTEEIGRLQEALARLRPF